MVLNDEFKNKMIEINKEYNLGLDNYECECYSNCFYVLDELTNHQFEFEEIFDTYDFFSDVLYGKRPEIDIFDSDDAFKGFYRLSKRYSTTKNLTEQQRIYFCFALYQALCIMQVDSQNSDKMTWNMDVFEKGVSAIISEYEFSAKEFPNKFIIKKYSDYSKSDYGYCIENPIEVVSVRTEYQYLEGIQTENNKKITYNRIGSASRTDGIIVDCFDIYTKGLLKNKKIATLYISGYGFENTSHTPKGFKFIM